MPVHRVGKDCWQWGSHGKVYCGRGARAKAERQGRAAYSHGYQGAHEAQVPSELRRTLIAEVLTYLDSLDDPSEASADGVLDSVSSGLGRALTSDEEDVVLSAMRRESSVASRRSEPPPRAARGHVLAYDDRLTPADAARRAGKVIRKGGRLVAVAERQETLAGGRFYWRVFDMLFDAEGDPVLTFRYQSSGRVEGSQWFRLHNLIELPIDPLNPEPPRGRPRLEIPEDWLVPTPPRSD